MWKKVRCRLIASWGWRRSQGFGCSPIKAVRELGSERRETVRSPIYCGRWTLREPIPSTRGPGWTNLWCMSCTCQGHRSVAKFGTDKRWKHLSVKPFLRLMFVWDSRETIWLIGARCKARKGFSRGVLIYRAHYGNTKLCWYYFVKQLFKISFKNIDPKRSHCLGGSSGGVTPDPIPNSVVKPASADGSRKARVGHRQDNDSFLIQNFYFWCIFS